MGFFFWDFFLLIKVSGPVRKMSGFRTARTFKICRTSGPDVMSGRALIGLKCICEKQKNQKIRKKKLQKEFLESHFIFDKLKKLKNQFSFLMHNEPFLA